MQNDLDNQGKYNMKAVSTMVGILPGTLRAWERRYQMVAPVRNEAGHRLYSDNHVRKLKWLTQKVNDGFTISQAISLLEQEQKVSARPFNDQAEDRVSQLQRDILHAFLQFDERTVQDLMNEAFTIYTMDKVLIDILAPLLLQIGNMWEDGKITTAHEHFSTSILRSRIGAVMHAYPHNGILPKVVAVCAPGEWHELGLLIFTLYMRRKGYEVIYLGSSIKEHDIEVVLETVKPRFLFMSCTMTNNLSSTLELTLSLEKEFSNLVVGLGGSAIDSMNDEDKQKFHPNILGQSMNDWDHCFEEKTYSY
jgi:methanogenic corrinoid protein MtbC1